ncbi:Isocitrate lyase [Hondaea fermentalgiana]|uniref:Isocitrate lyase n=1 Tax=Hondaea fermentalgiana TaxID=2315210 RepID=A0A2R5GPJ6_9STRA|nr:Isocitrate lyase [Hondaea fermentalgiana]|eukprot:GBG32229.1 Isocitrate lyase [Hondaea fermentalgiana]
MVKGEDADVALSPAARLQKALQAHLGTGSEGADGKGPGVMLVPASYDALSAKLVEKAGFEAVFSAGFAAAASRGMPDTGLISFHEMLQAHDTVCEAVSPGYPVIADGDDGYGNAMNVQRTVKAFHKAGVAMVMLEDQVAPKQCGHTDGKQVLSREESVNKIRAAADARDALRRERRLPANDPGILILARTDARATHGLDEAIARCQAFLEAGADATFLEAPHSEEEMRQYCEQVDGIKMANMLARGKTPRLTGRKLRSMGYTFAAYPFDVLLAAKEAVKARLAEMHDQDAAPEPLDAEAVEELWHLTGFRRYEQEEKNYACKEAKRARLAQ